MPNSVMRDINGPDWPLGSIIVTVPGTPVNIMSLVDPGITETTASPLNPEFTTRFQQITFQGFKAGAHGLVPNTGNVYIVRKGVGGGTGNRDDYGAIIWVLTPGQTFILGSAALSQNVFSPYRYFADADNANDACQVTGLVMG